MVFLALLAADQGIYVSECQAFARSQIDYILGISGSYSFMVGMGRNHPEFYKHKAAYVVT